MTLAQAKALATELAPAFVPGSRAYLCTGESIFPIEELPIELIAPFERSPGVVGLDRERAASVLHALLSGIPLPPVNVYAPAIDRPSRYVLYHGYHRYHICFVLGYSHIPAAVNPWRGGDAL